MILYMYIAPGRGQNFDVKRKASSLYPFVASFKEISLKSDFIQFCTWFNAERGGSVVECRTPEREVRGSKPTAAVLCPWARHFTPRKYWLITQEAMAPSRHDWKIVDWDVKHQHNQPTWFNTAPGIINRCSRANNSKVNNPIWPKFELVRAFMPVLITCKFDKDPIKGDWEKMET